jgi:uncharacterized protein (TIGR02996 family)
MPKRKPKSPAKPKPKPEPVAGAESSSTPALVALPQEQAALLAAIVAHPAEYGRRLEYAEWLQKHGDTEQAAHVREWARVMQIPETGKCADEAAKLSAVANARGPEWLKPLGVSRIWQIPSGATWPPNGAVYQNTSAFFEDAPVLFARLPICDLRLFCVSGRGLDAEALHQLAGMPELARLGALYLVNNRQPIDLSGWKALIDSPHLRKLDTLVVQWSALTDAHATALAECTNLSNLRVLGLSSNHIQRRGLLALLRSPHLAHVKCASLCSNKVQIDEELLEAVIARFGTDTPFRYELHEQTEFNTGPAPAPTAPTTAANKANATAKPIPDEQAAILAAIIAKSDEDTPRLVYADWLQEHGDEEQAAHIRDSIRVVHMKKGKARDEKEREILKIAEKRGDKWLAGIGITGTREFYHSDNRWLPDAVVYRNIRTFFDDAPALFARLPIRDLALYWHGGRGLDAEALRELAAMPELARLHALRLANYGHQLDLRGWKTLLNSPHLRGLRHLECCQALVDDHAFVLASCDNLKGLIALNLSENGIGTTGALAIVNSPHLANVKKLSFAVNEEIYEDEDYPTPYRALVRTLTARFGSADCLEEYI